MGTQIIHVYAMSQLAILHYPDLRLHTVAQPIATVDERIRQLANDMLETMYAAEGVGLAATHVNVHERLFVMDTSETRDQPYIFINPEIIERSTEMKVGDEGCLSVPDVRDKVNRHVWVTVRALDRHGKTFDLQAQGLAAICIQHEMDHLLGKVFVEYLSLLKRDRIKAKIHKRNRSA